MQLHQRLDEIVALDATLWAISPDDPEKLADFVAEESLEIPMLRDPELAVADAYGVVADNGKVPHPTTVVIAPDGTVTWLRVDEDYSQRPPTDNILAALGAAGNESSPSSSQ